MALPYVTPGQLALVENKINDLNEKLTDDDIDSIKAVQSPKNATANQVLTADGNGKAVYKDASGEQYTIRNTNMTSGSDQLRIITDGPFNERKTDGAYIMITPVFYDAKKIIGIVSPNIQYVLLKDVYYGPNEFSYVYGQGSYCTIYIPKELCNKIGVTDGMYCAYKWQPAIMYIPK